mmetsp:Transcript_46632/g.113381  ORF Transcript_46632/g.113381 Transcript_46632/m.113381 type:complete len:225 (-) Transcript_46632:995-1669(-)
MGASPHDGPRLVTGSLQSTRLPPRLLPALGTPRRQACQRAALSGPVAGEAVRLRAGEGVPRGRLRHDGQHWNQTVHGTRGLPQGEGLRHTSGRLLGRHDHVADEHREAPVGGAPGGGGGAAGRRRRGAQAASQRRRLAGHAPSALPGVALGPIKAPTRRRGGLFPREDAREARPPVGLLLQPGLVRGLRLVLGGGEARQAVNAWGSARGACIVSHSARCAQGLG